MNDTICSSGRIVFISASPGVWGAEESLITLAKALKRRDHDVELVCFSGSLERRWRTEIGTEPILAGESPNPDSMKFSTSSRLWWRYLSASRKNDSVILFTYYLVIFAPWVRLALIGKRTSLVLDMHDNLPGRRGQLLLQGCSIFVHKIVAVSEFTSVQFGFLKKRVSVLTRPIDNVSNRASAPNSGAGRRLRVGIVGRLVKAKGHELLIQAASRLGEEIELIVRGAGDGSPEDVTEVVLQRGSAALGTRFMFEGMVPRDRVMDGLDVLVVANNREPLGRTVLEAQLNGVVALVPDTGGSSELVEHRATGLKYRSEDASSLASALQSLLDDEGLRSNLVSAARASAEVVSSPDAYAQSYTQAIKFESLPTQ